MIISHLAQYFPMFFEKSPDRTHYNLIIFKRLFSFSKSETRLEHQLYPMLFLHSIQDAIVDRIQHPACTNETMDDTKPVELFKNVYSMADRSAYQLFILNGQYYIHSRAQTKRFYQIQYNSDRNHILQRLLTDVESQKLLSQISEHPALYQLFFQDYRLRKIPPSVYTSICAFIMENRLIQIPDDLEFPPVTSENALQNFFFRITYGTCAQETVSTKHSELLIWFQPQIGWLGSFYSFEFQNKKFLISRSWDEQDLNIWSNYIDREFLGEIDPPQEIRYRLIASIFGITPFQLNQWMATLHFIWPLHQDATLREQQHTLKQMSLMLAPVSSDVADYRSYYEVDTISKIPKKIMSEMDRLFAIILLRSLENSAQRLLTGIAVRENQWKSIAPYLDHLFQKFSSNYQWPDISENAQNMIHFFFQFTRHRRMSNLPSNQNDLRTLIINLNLLLNMKITQSNQGCYHCWQIMELALWAQRNLTPLRDMLSGMFPLILEKYSQLNGPASELVTQFDQFERPDAMYISHLRNFLLKENRDLKKSFIKSYLRKEIASFSECVTLIEEPFLPHEFHDVFFQTCISEKISLAPLLKSSQDYHDLKRYIQLTSEEEIDYLMNEFILAIELYPGKEWAINALEDLLSMISRSTIPEQVITLLINMISHRDKFFYPTWGQYQAGMPKKMIDRLLSCTINNISLLRVFLQQKQLSRIYHHYFLNNDHQSPDFLMAFSQCATTLSTSQDLKDFLSVYAANTLQVHFPQIEEYLIPLLHLAILEAHSFDEINLLFKKLSPQNVQRIFETSDFEFSLITTCNRLLNLQPMTYDLFVVFARVLLKLPESIQSHFFSNELKKPDLNWIQSVQQFHNIWGILPPHLKNLLIDRIGSRLHAQTQTLSDSILYWQSIPLLLRIPLILQKKELCLNSILLDGVSYTPLEFDSLNALIDSDDLDDLIEYITSPTAFHDVFSRLTESQKISLIEHWNSCHDFSANVQSILSQMLTTQKCITLSLIQLYLLVPQQYRGLDLLPILSHKPDADSSLLFVFDLNWPDFEEQLMIYDYIALSWYRYFSFHHLNQMLQFLPTTVLKDYAIAHMEQHYSFCFSTCFYSPRQKTLLLSQSKQIQHQKIQEKLAK